MSELVVEPWTNAIGQTINPGDEVIYVGTGYGHSVSVKKGKFGGVRYADVRRYRPLKDADGNAIMDERYGGKYPKQEIYTSREPVAVRVEEVNRGHKYTYGYDENGKYFSKESDEIHYGVATLPRMRVYKIDTSVLNMEF